MHQLSHWSRCIPTLLTITAMLFTFAVGPALRALLGGLMLACTTAQPSDADTLTLDIGAQRRPCVGEAVRQCLVVRHVGDTAWRNFYDAIDGFTHEAGYRYRILVERQVVPKPPADGSRYRYRLVRVLSRERESGPASGF